NPDNVFLSPEDRDLISGRRKFERYSVTTAAKEFSPLLVLGDFGTRKTTAFRELSRVHLQEFRKQGGMLPLYIPIVALQPTEKMGVAEQLINYAFRQLHPKLDYDATRIWELMEKHQFLLLFDGLSEIAEHLIESYCISFRDFARKL